jgi:hypothetical protein
MLNVDSGVGVAPAISPEIPGLGLMPGIPKMERTHT